MAAQLPEGPRILLNDGNAFLSMDRPVVERLKNSKDDKYLDAFAKIDALIREYDTVNHYTGEAIFVDPYQGQWSVLLETLVFCSREYTPEKTTELRNAHKAYAEKLAAISKAAYQLSDAIRVAGNSTEKFGLSADADVHPLGLLQSTIENQADPETRHRFNSSGFNSLSPAELIRQARSFDLKYYPPISALLNEIARQYAQGYEATTEAKVTTKKNKANEFLLHFFEGLEHSIDINQITPRLLEKGLITYAKWGAVFDVALGFDDKPDWNQLLKDFKNPRKKQGGN